MKAFSVDTRHQGNDMIIKFTGELDASSCTIADNTLEDVIASSPKAILVDCSELKYISSAGLGVLLAAFQACNLKGISFVLFDMKPKTRNVFEILGLDKVIKSASSLDEAQQLINQ